MKPCFITKKNLSLEHCHLYVECSRTRSISVFVDSSRLTLDVIRLFKNKQENQ
jgi:hypothetical protein